MSISLRRPFVRALSAFSLSSFSVAGLFFGLLLPSVASAQATVESKFDKQMDRIDFGIGGMGSFNTTTKGTTYLGTTLNDVPGNTLGAITQLRYTIKPYFGLEANWGYARYTQKFSSSNGTDLYVQANADEYTVGYVAHIPHEIFGLKPFVSAGLGSTAYKPTRLGGEGLSAQARATYYYSVGFDDMVFGGPHFGVRGQFRQTIGLAPDFGQNYLTIKQRTIATEPSFGIYWRF